MTGALSNCSNCGGRLTASADGRAVSCVYCGSSAVASIDPAALAAGISMDSKSVHQGFDTLLATFRDTFASNTTIYEKGLFKKEAHAFDVTLDESTFRLSRHGHKLTAERITIVRGITLKNETMPLEAWLRALAEKLSEMANASAAARDAFSRIAR